MLPPIFIIGCARSGTTILGKFFENNSQCQYFNEIDVWKKNSLNETFFKFFKQKSVPFLKRHDKTMIFVRILDYQLKLFFQILGFSKNDIGHKLTNQNVDDSNVNQIHFFINSLSKDRLVIKHPRNSLRISFIKKLFPDAKFLHIVRDGRDVTCSLMGKNHKWYWAHMKPPGWKKWQKEHPVGPEKYAWQWNETINIINSDRIELKPTDFIEIKYEDLVNNSEKTMRRVFEQFEIPFEKPQENLSKMVVDKTNRSLEATPGWTVQNHSKSIGRYKENLTTEELIKVEKILGTNNNKIYNT